jgi:uncharacterized protein YbjT (DUF2867 family)
VRVLTIGATGKFGHFVIPELKKRGVTVRALLRDPQQESTARQHGVDETVIANLEQPATLAAATEGVDGVFHLGPAFAPTESQMGINMVEAARAAGVRKFVFSSVIHPSLPLTNHRAKIPVEEAVYHSGMIFTVLQPAMFMQTIQGGWPRIVEKRRFVLPYSIHQKGTYVDYRDVAECAALAITTDRLDNGTFELSAPGMLNRIEITGLMSEALGSTIEPAQADFEAWASESHLPRGPVRDGMKLMYAQYDRYGFAGGNGLILRTILQREPRTMKQFLSELAGRSQSRAA